MPEDPCKCLNCHHSTAYHILSPMKEGDPAISTNCVFATCSCPGYRYVKYEESVAAFWEEYNA